jgi:hypothetical protein
VIAKEIAAPRTGGSFGRLVSYLTSSEGKAERVGTVRLSNCVSVDTESAVLEVQNTQARNQRARHTTYHLMLAFPAGEEPSADVLEQLERRACEALGFTEHHRVSVVHHDTDHLHVHVAINRVHPRTAKAHSPSFSKLALDRLCVELETEYALQPVRHRERDRQANVGATVARTEPGRATELERVSGLESLVGFVRRECGRDLQMARSWAEIHDVAGAHGLRAQLHGNGLVFVTPDGIAVKASSVSRELSKAAVERRIGPFERAAAAPTVVRRQYHKRPPHGASAGLYDQYLRERATTAARRRDVVAGMWEQRSQDEERLRTASHRRWNAIRFIAKGRIAWALWSAYARQADRRARECAMFRYRTGLRKAAKRQATGWLAWLQERAARGDADALAALRARRTARSSAARNTISGEASGQGMLPKPDGVTATGTVIYRVPGGSIRDDGQRLYLTQSATSPAAAEALLRSAYARYGSRVAVDGDGTFRARLERAAVRTSLPTTLVHHRPGRRPGHPQSMEETFDVVRRQRGRSQ